MSTKLTTLLAAYRGAVANRMLCGGPPKCYNGALHRLAEEAAHDAILAHVAALAAPAAPPPAAAPATCGVADEGWEQFPCTKPKGHTGEHGWTGHVSLKSLRVDTAVPSQPEATACPECGGRGWTPGEAVATGYDKSGDPYPYPYPTQEPCEACGGTGRAPADWGAR